MFSQSKTLNPMLLLCTVNDYHFLQEDVTSLQSSPWCCDSDLCLSDYRIHLIVFLNLYTREFQTFILWIWGAVLVGFLQTSPVMGHFHLHCTDLHLLVDPCERLCDTSVNARLVPQSAATSPAGCPNQPPYRKHLTGQRSSAVPLRK